MGAVDKVCNPLGLLLELKRLSAAYLVSTKGNSASASEE